MIVHLGFSFNFKFLMKTQINLGAGSLVGHIADDQEFSKWKPNSLLIPFPLPFQTLFSS